MAAPKTWTNIPLIAGDLNEEIRDRFNAIAAQLATPIWIPAADFGLGTGAARGVVGSSGGLVRFDAWAMDASTDEYVITSLRLPDHWDGGDITIKVRWAPSSTNTGGVRWDVSIAAVGLGEQIDKAADETESLTQAASGTTDALHETSALTFSPLGQFLRITVNRDANNGADTYTADCYFLGLLIEYGSEVSW